MSTREMVVLNAPVDPRAEAGAPSPPGFRPKANKLTDAEVNSAAMEAGLVKLDARSIRSCRTLGAFVDQEGALSVGQGLYWLTAHNLAKAINRCGDLIDKPPPINRDEGETPAQVMTDLMKAMAELSGKMIKTAGGIAAMAKIQKEVENQAPPPVSPFLKGQTVVPIQNNITIHQPAGPDVSASNPGV